MKTLSPPEHQQVLAHLLKEVRTDAGLTQEQLADSLACKQADVSKVERGVRQISHLELRHWLAALGSDVAIFESKLRTRLDRLGLSKPSPPGGMRRKRQRL